MARSSALKVSRGKPVEIALTCSNMCWRRVGKLAAFELEQRGWTKSRLCYEATHPVTDKPMSASTLNKLLDGDYARGGPFIATLQRVFLIGFRSSGYQLVMTTRGSKLVKD